MAKWFVLSTWEEWSRVQRLGRGAVSSFDKYFGRIKRLIEHGGPLHSGYNDWGMLFVCGAPGFETCHLRFSIYLFIFFLKELNLGLLLGLGSVWKIKTREENNKSS